MEEESFTFVQSLTGDEIVAVGYNEGPWIVVGKNVESLECIKKGDKILLNKGADSAETRVIVAITVVRHMLGWYYEFLAPRRIASTNQRVGYISHQAIESENYVLLRPGTEIIGGHKSGFNGNNGLILAAEFVGGDPELFEDWAYLVAPVDTLRFWSSGINWITLGDIFAPIEGPERIINLREFFAEAGIPNGASIEALIKDAEIELINYLSLSPEKI